MKRILLSLIGCAALSLSAFAQQQSGWCATDAVLEEQINGDQSIRDQIHQSILQAVASGGFGEKVTKTVPVVVHVLYDTPQGNISEAQIQSALDVLNQDYNRLNSDASFTRNTTNAPFAPRAASMDIEFKLAKLDPSGNCTNGIIRKQVVSAATNEVNQSTQPHKFTGSGGSSAWPRDKYLNIWVVNSIGVSSGGSYIAGYAQFPWWGAANTYGLVMRNDGMGTIGTASGSDGRTLTHEVGHCFGLLHIFQDGCGSNGSDCTSQGDYCCDTPPQADSDFSCDQTFNSCSQVPNGDPYGINVYDQIENYMSYNGCQNMFSQDQVALMEGAIAGNSWMTNLVSATNATATGINLPDILCQANFSADNTTVCSGSQVQFTDESYSVANGWTWTFTGGNPPNSTDQNPLVTYTNPGTYQVKLVATDGSNSDTETKTSYITVLPASSALPILEDFESYSTLSNIPEWQIVNGTGNGFELATTGLNSSKSARLVNYNQTAGDVDELQSALPVDLSGVSQVTLSFRYAHKRRNTSDADKLKLSITNNCGVTWAVRRTLLLANESAVQSTSFTPSSANDWTTVHVTNITGSYLVDNFRYKFSFEGGAGNNMYIDNINIYEGGPSDDLVTGTSGLNELTLLKDLALYPNPAEDELNVKFTLDASQKVQLNISDLTGKMIQRNNVNGATGSNVVLIDTKGLSPGVYFMNIVTNELKETRQFIVK